MSNKFVPLCALVSGGCLYAQLDLLTLRESESIVERIPSVVAAQKKGACPQLLPTYDSEEELAFQVRGGCGTTGGMLINNYALNRRTGAVTTWGDDPKSALGPDGQELARQLVQQAHSRVLSLGESRCLALEAAKSLPGWSEKDSSVSVRPFGRRERSKAQYTAVFRSAAHPVEIGRLLTVNPVTAEIRDDETGLNLMSAALGALTAKMFALRAQPWLTDADAILVALQIPAVAARVPEGCRFHAGGAFNSDEVVAGASCDGQARGGAVAINLRTGQVVDADSRIVLASAEAKRLAREILDERERQRTNIRKEIDSVCRAE